MASPIVSIQTFEITLADGVASASVAIAAGNVADCTPRISYRAQNTEVAHTSLLVRPRFLTGPNRLEVVRTGTVGPLTVQAVVIEWDTTLVSVITGSESFTGATLDVTIGAVDLARAWMTFGFDATAGGDNDESAVRGMLTTTTNIHFERDAITNTVDLEWWVLEDLTGGDVWTVQRVVALAIPGVTADATITAVALDRTLSFSSQLLNNFGAEPNEWGVTFLFDSTTFRYVREDPAGTAMCDAFVVEFAVNTGVTVQRGSIVMSGVETGTATITALNDLARSFAHVPMVPNGCSSDNNSNINLAFGSIEVLNATTVEANAAEDTSVETVFFEVIEFEPDRDGEGTTAFDGSGELHSALDGDGDTALDGSGELHSAYDGAGDTALDGSGELHSAFDGAGDTALDGSGELHSALDGESTTALDGSGELHSALDGAGETALDGSGELHSAYDGAGEMAFSGDAQLHHALFDEGDTSFDGSGELHSAYDGASTTAFSGDATRFDDFIGEGETAFSGDANPEENYDGEGTAAFDGSGELHSAYDGAGEVAFDGSAEQQILFDGEGTVGFSGDANPEENYIGTSTTAFDGSGELQIVFDGESTTAFDGSGELHSAYDGASTTEFAGSSDPDENYIGTSTTAFSGIGDLQLRLEQDAPEGVSPIDMRRERKDKPFAMKRGDR